MHKIYNIPKASITKPKTQQKIDKKKASNKKELQIHHKQKDEKQQKKNVYITNHTSNIVYIQLRD